jgi:hypothetical protein
MPDEARISRTIDALVVDPVDDASRRRAALVVCDAMLRAGDTASEIHEVLACLDLLTVKRI